MLAQVEEWAWVKVEIEQAVAWCHIHGLECEEGGLCPDSAGSRSPWRIQSEALVNNACTKGGSGGPERPEYQGCLVRAGQSGVTQRMFFRILS